MTTKAGYWIGGGLIVFAVVVAVLWAVIAGAHLVSTIDDFQRVTIPGTTTVQLGAHKVVLYVEGPAADHSIPPVRVLVTDARTGTPLPIRTYGGSLTYSFHRTGSAQATVTPTHAGAYRVQTSSERRAMRWRSATASRASSWQRSPARSCWAACSASRAS